MHLCRQAGAGGGGSELKKKGKREARTGTTQSRACNDAAPSILHFMDENVPDGPCAFAAVRSETEGSGARCSTLRPALLPAGWEARPKNEHPLSFKVYLI